MNHDRIRRLEPLFRSGGFSLIEIMISLAIGMVVALAVFVSMAANGRHLQMNEGLSESQENVRLGFELIARDVRQARDTSCGAVQTSNLATGVWNGTWVGTWWPVRGFAGTAASGAVAFGTAAGERVDGTEALQLQGSAEALLIETITSGGANVELMTAAAPLANPDGLVLACDLRQASLHEVASGAGKELTLKQPIVVSDPDDPQFQLARYTAVTWFIGNSGRDEEGGRSLFRTRLGADGQQLTEEILPGVTELNVRYHRIGEADFITASDPALATAADWSRVNAIELTLVTETTQAHITTDIANVDPTLVGSNGRLRRSATQVVAVRSVQP